jgi:hypothetical protein
MLPGYAILADWTEQVIACCAAWDVSSCHRLLVSLFFCKQHQQPAAAAAMRIAMKQRCQQPLAYDTHYRSEYSVLAVHHAAQFLGFPRFQISGCRVTKAAAAPSLLTQLPSLSVEPAGQGTAVFLVQLQKQAGKQEKAAVQSMCWLKMSFTTMHTVGALAVQLLLL